MKAVILAGGYGTRISEESAVRPKPMVEIGSKPIIWHIMKLYSAHGIEDFVICAGYKAYLLKQYFANYFLQAADIVVDLKENRVETLASAAEPWRVTIVDTGESTMTGGRIKRAREIIGEDTFCLTYGDCVTDIDIRREIEFHRTSGADVTVAAVQPPGRFGMLTLEAGTDSVTGFREKPTGDGGWVNGGFFVVEPRVLDYIDSDQTMWEHEPLERIAGEGGLRAFKHDGFWHPMDTLHDKMVLEEYWASGSAPWKVW